MLKSEKFLLFVEEIVMGKHNLFSYEKIRANPECLNQVMNHMKETVSVWEDTRKLANLKYTDELDGFGKKVKGIIRIRLGFIQNKYEPDMYAKGRFIRNFDNYKKFFTENAIRKALTNVGPNDFTTKEDAYEKLFDIAEDFAYSTPLFALAEKIVGIETDEYFYLQRTGASTGIEKNIKN